MDIYKVYHIMCPINQTVIYKNHEISRIANIYQHYTTCNIKIQQNCRILSYNKKLSPLHIGKEIFIIQPQILYHFLLHIYAHKNFQAL